MANVLILHGWGSRSQNWNRVKGLLESKGHKVFVPDLPGFGENPAPKTPWSIDDYTDWVKQYINENIKEPFFLIGHSFGGGLSVKLANELPEMARKLILIGAKVRRQRAFKYYIGLVLSKLGGLIFYVPVLSFLRPIGRKILYKIVGTKDYYALEIKKATTMKETFKKVVCQDLTGYLAGIKIATLIIWGAKDKMTPLRDAYLIKEKISDSRLEIIKNQGHVPHMEVPEILAEKILNFIE
ncbi:MAG: alpha/beta hydrolase [Candidatus Nealsonbacteria bacterium]|nr:alpha/beta hydrolase [Candidatus Nealsonbacteria bacterium]